jgi:hypothetical protein
LDSKRKKINRPPNAKKSWFTKDLSDKSSSSEEFENKESAYYEFNREEINKEFRKGIKKYYLFEVKKTPCIQDLEEFIIFKTKLQSEEAQDDMAKDDLIYYSNKEKWSKIL